VVIRAEKGSVFEFGSVSSILVIAISSRQKAVIAATFMSGNDIAVRVAFGATAR